MPDDAVEMRAGSFSLTGRPRITVLGVPFAHVQLPDGDDLYLTDYGAPFAGHLLPQSYWTDRAWFADHNRKLPGTSTLYKIMTKAVAGRSIDIVLKWNRMGQDIPGRTQTSDLAGAKFNSPFEEFSLLLELRNTKFESPGVIYTHKPLGIYVPGQHVEVDRLGRKRYVIEAIQRNHTEVTLDINRRYAVSYEWIRGDAAVDPFEAGLLDRETLARFIE